MARPAGWVPRRKRPPNMKREQKQQIREQRYFEQRGKCAACRADLVMNDDQHPHRATIDHIVPRSRGGTNNPNNLRLLCARCNGERGNTMDRDAYMPDSAGTFGEAKPSERKCKCGAPMTVQVWESHCGGYEDDRYTCTACAAVLWVDGIDS